jgi:uncharacterized protein (TIGR03032 family)
MTAATNEPSVSSQSDGKILITHEHSSSLVEVLKEIRGSLLISTYQAGKLVAVGVSNDDLSVSMHHFERAMGIAVGAEGIAVGAGAQIWFLQSMPAIAPRLLPAGKHDSCFMARSAHVTGEIHSHEMCYSRAGLCVVNTIFSCLCTLQPNLSFMPRWKPSFISALVPEDRCHLNGLAMENGQPRYVTALSQTDTDQGWRKTKAESGCLIDVLRDVILAEGLSMPHSPRIHQGRIWLLESGTGRFLVLDPSTGQRETVAELPGYARGFSIAGPYAFVGLSTLRRFEGLEDLPISQRRDELKCGMLVIELASGRTVAHLNFVQGITEVFAVEVLPGTRCPGISGPFVVKDNTQPLYAIPDNWVPRGDAPVAG